MNNQEMNSGREERSLEGTTDRRESTVGLTPAEKRKEYLRRYYREHRDKAREYQRRYNITYRKKQRVGAGPKGDLVPRQKVQNMYTVSDIMQSPAEKAVKIIDMICRGERSFTM